MIGTKQDKKLFDIMLQKKNFLNKKIEKKQVFDYLINNKNFLIKNPKLLNILEFPSNWKTEKNVIDFNFQQSKKLQKDNKLLKSVIKEILSTENENFKSQNNILKISLQITNANNLNELTSIINKNSSYYLGVDFVNLFTNNKDFLNLDKKNILKKLNNEHFKKAFQGNESINLQNKKELLNIFFPLNKAAIKSFILLKLKISSQNYFIICFQ